MVVLPSILDIDQARACLRELASEDRVATMGKFFKSGDGWAGNDKIIGVSVPDNRKVAKRFYRVATMGNVEELLRSCIHEEKLLGVLVLVEKFQRAKSPSDREGIVKFYLNEDNLNCIDNWDLVDSSCYKILGTHLLQNIGEAMKVLGKLAVSGSIWHRRLAVVATMPFIKKGIFNPTIEIVEKLLGDSEDLVQKAIGWMLREIGVQSKETLLFFLDQYYLRMAPVAVRYATEKLSAQEKVAYKRRKKVVV